MLYNRTRQFKTLKILPKKLDDIYNLTDIISMKLQKVHLHNTDIMYKLNTIYMSICIHNTLVPINVMYIIWIGAKNLKLKSIT